MRNVFIFSFNNISFVQPYDFCVAYKIGMLLGRCEQIHLNKRVLSDITFIIFITSVAINIYI